MQVMPFIAVVDYFSASMGTHYNGPSECTLNIFTIFISVPISPILLI